MAHLQRAMLLVQYMSTQRWHARRLRKASAAGNYPSRALFLLQSVFCNYTKDYRPTPGKEKPWLVGLGMRCNSPFFTKASAKFKTTPKLLEKVLRDVHNNGMSLLTPIPTTNTQELSGLSKILAPWGLPPARISASLYDKEACTRGLW
ncbi:unnamed protein product [Polarella glacialis]|uniref:Uncharacterized protein n=1 Tax=Polarella glacialis TaxID=89957 RepID=A0A813J0C1_POLGL|nr:unnamed protein product [Polarella glacialis]